MKLACFNVVILFSAILGTQRIIKSKRKSVSETHNNDSFKSFLELLIESSGGNQGYTDVELREETLVIVLAGTDTSAVGASFTTLMLSKYPEVQEKVYLELKDVFGDSDRPIIPEDLPRLKYLDAVIKETMRLYPPVPIISRQVEKDIQLPSGVTLVKGCGVLMNIWAVHRNPKYWGDDADLFRPERFIDSTLEHPAAFMPFSYGPRGCLGYQYAMMSMKTAVAALLRRYRVLPVTPDCAVTPENAQESTALHADNKTKPLRVSFDIMMRHVHNFKIQLESRVNHSIE